MPRTRVGDRLSAPACPPGVDPAELARDLHRWHDTFVETGQAGGPVRPLVLESWLRSLDGGLDPERSLAPVQMADDELSAQRAEHPLAAVMPLVRRLLVDDAIGAGLLVAVTDAAGRLLWVEGESRLRTRAQQMHFIEGATWTEAAAGTNAPGTALALDRAVQIFAAEHLARPVTPWSCAAAPIHDPETGAVLGALDVTGGDEVASPQSLTLVRATVAAVESELRWQRRTEPPPLRAARRSARGLALATLGLHRGQIRSAGSESALSLRHTEVLLLLSEARDGLTTEQLSLALHEHDLAPVTIRSELSRLRALLPQVRLGSRPYRIGAPLRTDVDEIRQDLHRGRYQQALGRYRGPVLPQSQAPGIVSLRDDLHTRLRAALLDTSDPDLLLRFADTEHSRLDLAVWEAALACLPVSSPRAADVGAHVDRLAAELAVAPAAG